MHIYIDDKCFRVYLRNVSRNLALEAVRTRCIAAALLSLSAVLHGDEQKQQVGSDGYKTVSVGADKLPVRVKERPNVYEHVSSSYSAENKLADGSVKLQPDQPNYSSTSSLANKQFASSNASFSKDQSSIEEQKQRTFITKSYFSKASSHTDHSTPNLNTKISPVASSAYSRSASGFNKNYTTSSSDMGKATTPLYASTTSKDQGRTATLGGKKIEAFPSATLTAKPYLGPEATAIHKDMTAMNQALSRMSALPGRPLTIDEVRELINHDTKPDLETKPEPPSKPLNDPDYKPIPSPEPPPAKNDNQSDVVPPPGTMAGAQPPENSDPLPQ